MTSVAPPSVPPKVSPQAALVQRPATSGLSAEVALIAAVLFAAFGHILIKYGLNSVPQLAGQPVVARLLGYLLTPTVLVGLGIYGMGTLLWVVAVAKRDISYLFPITSLNYVVVTLAGTWLFGETVSIQRWSSILVVMIGVALLMRSSAGERKG